MKSYKFEEEFAKRHPDRLQLLRYMHEAIGVDMLSWSDLTTLNLSRIKEYWHSIILAEVISRRESKREMTA